MALVRQGRRPEAARSFEEGVTLARRMPYPYAEARALHEWAAMDAASGDGAQARARLQQALAIFTHLGARKDVERTTEALAALPGQ